MSDGEIIEEGSHNDLIEHKGVYNTLINIQNGYSQKTEKSSAKTSPEDAG
jgi:ABC-type transport system involved in cytochrome bd biosynthesis fused ATPase/permease subunit